MRRRRGILRSGPINDQNLSYVLDGGCFKLLADLFKQRISRLAICFRSNLDELVSIETGSDFVDDSLGKSLVADNHDGMQSVCASAQFATLGGRKIEQLMSPFSILG